MPPKAPTLKFKPKLVIRQATSTSGNDNAPASPSSTVNDLDDLSLVQLDRLRRQQEEAAQQQQQQQLQQLPHSPTSATGSNSKPASPHSPAGGVMCPRGRGGGAGSFASRQRGIDSYVDASRYPVTAPPLPANTINRIVLAGSRAGGEMGGNNEEEEAMAMHLGPHTRVYAPIPLDPSLPARMRQQSRRHAPDANNEEGEAEEESAALQDKRPPDGTAFLREYDAETAQMYEANMHFYRDTLCPVMRANTLTRDAADDTTITTTEPPQPQQTNTSSSSSSSSPALPLVWLQLPRAFGKDTLDMHALPPGKVGELKVMRSGRMVLEIAGVEYEVAAEDTNTSTREDDARNDGSKNNNNNSVGQQDGACTMAVATMPSGNPLDPAAQPSCYELGMLTRKLICTPALDKMLPSAPCKPEDTSHE